MILSDTDLRRRCWSGLVVAPGIYGENTDEYAAWEREHIQPASVEVTLADTVIIPNPHTASTKILNDRFEIGPNEFWLASTQETVNVPNDLIGFVHGKSSLARKGLLVHITAGLLDPGFSGQITLELKNVSHEPIELREGMPIAQLTFQTLTSPSERPYGSKGLGSHYQGQVGTTESKV